MTGRALARLAAVAAAFHTGCYSFAWGPQPLAPAAASAAAPLSTAAILRVNEAGLVWGDGGFGELVRQRLLSAGAFEEVRYPVEPRDPPEWVVEVVPVERVEPHYVWAFVSTVLYLPLLGAPALADYVVRCDVRVRRGGEVVQEFRLDSRILIGEGAIAEPQETLAKVRNAVARDLVPRIAQGVASREGARLAAPSPAASP